MHLFPVLFRHNLLAKNIITEVSKTKMRKVAIKSQIWNCLIFAKMLAKILISQNMLILSFWNSFNIKISVCCSFQKTMWMLQWNFRSQCFLWSTSAYSRYKNSYKCITWKQKYKIALLLLLLFTCTCLPFVFIDVNYC